LLSALIAKVNAMNTAQKIIQIAAVIVPIVRVIAVVAAN